MLTQVSNELDVRMGTGQQAGGAVVAAPVAGSMYRGYAVVTAKYKLMYFTEEGDRRG